MGSEMCIRDRLCSAAQWATHPGLRSAPILLKFLKNDTALAVTAAESEKADYAALYVHRYHNSFRTAMKALDSSLGACFLLIWNILDYYVMLVLFVWSF